MKKREKAVGSRPEAEQTRCFPPPASRLPLSLLSSFIPHPSSLKTSLLFYAFLLFFPNIQAMKIETM